jgi:cytochrome P450
VSVDADRLFTWEGCQDPHALYEPLLAGPPVITWGSGRLAVHHDAVVAALRDGALGHTQPEPPPSEALADTVARTMFIVRNPPEHTHLRGFVARWFTPKAVRAMVPSVEALTARLLDAMADKGGDADLLQELAGPLPVAVIADLFDVAEADRADFRRWSEEMVLPEGEISDDALARAAAARDAFVAFLAFLIEHRRHRPGPDLVSTLVAAADADPVLVDADVIATCQLLLFAGHETTVNLIGNGTLALLRSPHERARLVDGEVSAAAAVEELLRYDGPVHLTARSVLEPVTLAGVDLEPGELVTVLLGAANRDPRRFDDPARLDLGRPNNQHVGFGSGIHFCLGAALARMEAQVAIPALFARFPTLQLATDDLTWRHSLMLRGLTALPVSW